MKLPSTTLKAFLCGIGLGVATVTPIAVDIILHNTYHGKTHHRLMVSPTFTKEQQQEVRNAAHKWEMAVGNPRALTISVEVGQCPSKSDVVEGCLVPTDNIIDCSPVTKQAVGCTSSHSYYSQVLVDTKCGDIHTFSHITQHEIGHVLGIFDTDDHKRVMFHSVDCAEIQSASTQDVSPGDVDEYMKEKR